MYLKNPVPPYILAWLEFTKKPMPSFELHFYYPKRTDATVCQCVDRGLLAKENRTQRMWGLIVLLILSKLLSPRCCQTFFHLALYLSPYYVLDILKRSILMTTLLDFFLVVAIMAQSPYSCGYGDSRKEGTLADLLQFMECPLYLTS